MNTTFLTAIILSATGLVIRYQINRRRFNRRGIGGLQQFPTYGKFIITMTTVLSANDADKKLTGIKTLENMEADYIIDILSQCQGKIADPGGAAEILGLPSSTLNSKIKKLGITKYFNK